MLDTLRFLVEQEAFDSVLSDYLQAAWPVPMFVEDKLKCGQFQELMRAYYPIPTPEDYFRGENPAIDEADFSALKKAVGGKIRKLTRLAQQANSAISGDPNFEAEDILNIILKAYKVAAGREGNKHSTGIEKLKDLISLYTKNPLDTPAFGNKALNPT